MKFEKIASRIATGRPGLVNIYDYELVQPALEAFADAVIAWGETAIGDGNVPPEYMDVVLDQADLIRQLASGPIADLDLQAQELSDSPTLEETPEF
jgi:hypothetical protein